MGDLAGLGREKFIQLCILRELVPERKDHILEEQKTAAGVRIGHILKMMEIMKRMLMRLYTKT